MSVYRRTMPNGNIGYMVLKKSGKKGDKGHFESCANEDDAISKARDHARLRSEGDCIRRDMTQAQGVEWSAARQGLDKIGVTLPAVVANAIECIELMGTLPRVAEACKFYTAHHRQTTPKRVADVIAELMEHKKARGASERYLGALRFRFNHIGPAFARNIGDVTTSDIQGWLDAKKFSNSSCVDVRRILHLLFSFAVTRNYAIANVVTGTEKPPKVKRGAIKIFTPVEFAGLLASAPAGILPSLAIGGFAGIRAAEILRLDWADVDFAGRYLTVGADKAKTATHRIVPMCAALYAWLQPYAGRTGKIWAGNYGEFYLAIGEVATAAGIKWKNNALRHSYASYRFALTNDAGRVAGECGNSASVIYQHYRTPIAPAVAELYFSIKPESPVNVVPMARAVAQ